MFISWKPCLYLFLIYLTTLSVIRTRQRSVVEWQRIMQWTAHRKKRSESRHIPESTSRGCSNPEKAVWIVGYRVGFKPVTSEIQVGSVNVWQNRLGTSEGQVLTALLNVQVKYYSHQRCTNLVSQVRPGDYIFKGGAKYTWWSSVQNLLHVIFLLPTILRSYRFLENLQTLRF